MTPRRTDAVYAALVGAVFLSVAVWRIDLVLGAGRAAAWTFSRGGTARWFLLGEIALFAAVLAATWRIIPTSVRPAHDARVALAAAAAGWIVEAWGTRLGLWHYYTGETPPLWIVPVWPLGAAVVERLARSARERFGPAPAALYWTCAAAALGVVLVFLRPWLDRPAVWAVAALVAAALLTTRSPREEFWTLAAGVAAVFFADLWGTTNGCWSYYLHASSGGLWKGIAFGAAFDASVVLGCLRLVKNR